MGRLSNPTAWLQAHAQPTWAIKLLLSVYHHDDGGEYPEEHIVNPAQISKLISDYEERMQTINSEYWLANRDIVVSVGSVRFACTYDHDEDSWFSCHAGDNSISWADAMERFK